MGILETRESIEKEIANLEKKAATSKLSENDLQRLKELIAAGAFPICT